MSLSHWHNCGGRIAASSGASPSPRCAPPAPSSRLRTHAPHPSGLRGQALAASSGRRVTWMSAAAAYARRSAAGVPPSCGTRHAAPVAAAAATSRAAPAAPPAASSIAGQRSSPPTLTARGGGADGLSLGWPDDDDVLASRAPSLPAAKVRAGGGGLPVTFDVMGLAQSMVDMTVDAEVDDAMLRRLGLAKGGRRVLSSAEERSEVLALLAEEELPTELTPGGSLANTLVGIARLSAAYDAKARLSVGLSGAVGNDLLGEYFSGALADAGVTVLPDGGGAPATGTVLVLPSGDGQRSFLCHFPATHGPPSCAAARARVAGSRMLVVEGYLWDEPGAEASLPALIGAAADGGAMVVLTGGDPGVVARHRGAILNALDHCSQRGAEVALFANHDEASALLGEAHELGASGGAVRLAAALGALCSVAVVTDGGAGSHVVVRGLLSSLPPAALPGAVVDTCGAGDAYAAGFCFALLNGIDAPGAGAFGAAVAARVISRHGAQLTEAEVLELVAMLPASCALLPPIASIVGACGAAAAHAARMRA